MTEIKRLRWRLSKFVLDHIESSTKRISDSRLGAWLDSQEALRSVFNGIASKVVRPAVDSVTSSISTVRRREVFPWVLTWFLCACLGLTMCMPKSIVAVTMGIVATLAFFVISLRSPYSGLLIWLATATVLDTFMTSRIAEGVPLVTWSRICIIPLLFAFLFGERKSQTRGPSRAFDRVLWLYIIVMCFAAMRGAEPKTTLQTVLDTYLIPVMAYAFARRWITDEKRLAKLFAVLVFVGVYFAVLGIPEHFLGHTLFTPAEAVEVDLGTVRIQGPSNSVTECGMLLLMALFISITNLSTRRKRPANVLNIVLICLFVLGIALTLRRSVYVGLILGLGTMLFASRSVRKLVGSILLIAVLVSVLKWGAITQSKVYSNRIADTGPIYARLASYVNAWGVFTHNPWIGVGLGNYAKYREKYPTYNPAIPLSYARGAGVPHCEFLVVMVEGGILELVSFVLLLVMIAHMCSYLWRLTTGDGILRKDGVVVLCAFSIAYFFQFVEAEGLTYGKHITLVWFVLLGALIGTHLNSRKSTSMLSGAKTADKRKYSVRNSEA